MLGLFFLICCSRSCLAPDSLRTMADSTAEANVSDAILDEKEKDGSKGNRSTQLMKAKAAKLKRS
jgi:hypothetical protein